MFCNLRFLIAWSVALPLLVAAHGCNTSDTVPVYGRVSYKGEALANATLTFFPSTGRPIDAPISQGDYATQLVPGEYTSVVSVAIDVPPGYGRTHWNELPPQKFVLPDEYTARAKSTLKVTVKADQSEPINFELK